MSIDGALFPIDSIKTRLQASSNKTDFLKDAQTVSKYRGLASAMAASFPCAATFWLSYEYSKYALNANATTSGYLNVHVRHIVASSIAEVCQALVRCPFEVVKQNMQLGAYNTTKEAISHIWQTKGLTRGFYAGFGSFIMRDIPFSAIQFPLYDMLKIFSIRIIARRNGQSEATTQLPGILNSVNGSVAGATAGFLTTPLDVLKTR